MESQNERVGGNRRNMIGNILIFLMTFMLIASAGAKFAHVPKVVNELGAMGFDGGRLTLIAFLEVLSALLFVLPASRSAGLLLVSAYMGGAIATHIQHGHSPIQPAIVLSIIWLGTWLKHPESLWSFAGGREMKIERGSAEFLPLP